jgi:hypothetical protein
VGLALGVGGLRGRLGRSSGPPMPPQRSNTEALPCAPCTHTRTLCPLPQVHHQAAVAQRAPVLPRVWARLLPLRGHHAAPRPGHVPGQDTGGVPGVGAVHRRTRRPGGAPVWRQGGSDGPAGHRKRVLRAGRAGACGRPGAAACTWERRQRGRRGRALLPGRHERTAAATGLGCG